MILETERLILRPFLETDAADVYAYLKEPAANCFACMKLDSLDEARAEMKKRAGETEYYFAIVLKGDVYKRQMEYSISIPPYGYCIS